MLTCININLAESDSGTGITMGLPLVVKSHEYKFQKELSETRRWVAERNEKHIKVLSVRAKLTLSSANVLFGDWFNVFSFGSDYSGSYKIFYS